jgi:hypothetical protein
MSNRSELDTWASKVLLFLKPKSSHTANHSSVTQVETQVEIKILPFGQIKVLVLANLFENFVLIVETHEFGSPPFFI